jgi:hypothetical protein
MPYVPFLHLTSDRPHALYSSAGLPQLSRVRYRVVSSLSAEHSLRTKAAPINLHTEHLPLDRPHHGSHGTWPPRLDVYADGAARAEGDQHSLRVRRRQGAKPVLPLVLPRLIELILSWLLRGRAQDTRISREAAFWEEPYIVHIPLLGTNVCC